MALNSIEFRAVGGPQAKQGAYLALFQSRDLKRPDLRPN
jgi:hypothetical protein